MPELLAAVDLGMTYGTVVKTRALEAVSFTLEQGEFAAVVGQSGSGKSTLLNLIGLLDTPTDGTVRLLAEDVGGMSKKRRARLRNDAIGFVFQFHHLLPEFSVVDNVLMPAAIAGAIGPAQRERAGDLLDRLGLEGLADKGANELSGGQKQRVAIARALMNDPRLILADEPTGNLDSVNSAMVYRLFREINAESGTAFLIVTHERAIAQQTDRILEVRDGRLVQDVQNAYSGAPD